MTRRQPAATSRIVTQRGHTMPGTAATVLLIEDEWVMAKTYMAYMADEAVDVIHAATGKAALAALEAQMPEVILLDVHLPDMNGLDILETLRGREIPADVIVITSEGSMNLAIRAMQLGARDFLVKPFNRERLVTTLRNSLEHQHLAGIVQRYRDEIDRPGYHGFIGASLEMQRVYRIIECAAGSKAAIFITGESGTGKEVCAEAVHAASPRAGAPFVAVNCSAIPRDLMESEIFGHVRGAFTGAARDRDGAATQADGGTLFLDEICEMDLELQPKLLRFLQTGSFRRVGATQDETVDVRIICATNRDPLEEVRAGRFREDLYYRVHVLPIHLPPLRARNGDVIEIAQKFLAAYTREENKPFRSFDADAEDLLRSYSWPGNMRQLQNVIRNVVVLNEAQSVSVDMLLGPLGRASPPPGRPTLPPNQDAIPAPSEIRPLAEIEREAIETAVTQCGGNVPRAAHYLGISPATIYRKRAAWQRDG